MSIVLFEDERVEQLDPVAVGKPAFAITCGGYRLFDIVNQLAGPVHAFVRPHVRELAAADFPRYAIGAATPTGPALWINARLVPSVGALAQLREMLASGQAGTVRHGGAVSAAVLAAGQQPGNPGERLPAAADFDALDLPPISGELPLFEYPHDIIRHHLTTMVGNLEHRLAEGTYEQQADGVFLAPGAKLGQYCVADTRRGPIVLESEAEIGPYCYLSGPVHVGAGARVLEHAALKDAVSIGHTAKVGGEVEASIIERYTNKQHHGFLGHSYLGSWINLGAGTCNSDLKNTYGQVNMEYRGVKVATGMQFVGAIVGDYAKTAINTGIFTGKTIGACSMVYGFVTTNVPSFVNYARLFGQVTEAPVEVMVATQRRMFERRRVAQRPIDIQLLHDMYELTKHERHRTGETLSLEPLSL
jgi:UDP-N-acetylglucosamine diphosphorylase / glucose-1-phosphate thymidylyltransferase / UDP-N-acetylgalactosamine diphosphorylase / glucosamine-1-phosphate N-acetyltransferase / galactosamine-1-phosphate N-acetyltransferase